VGPSLDNPDPLEGLFSIFFVLVQESLTESRAHDPLPDSVMVSRVTPLSGQEGPLLGFPKPLLVGFG